MFVYLLVSSIQSVSLGSVSVGSTVTSSVVLSRSNKIHYINPPQLPTPVIPFLPKDERSVLTSQNKNPGGCSLWFSDSQKQWIGCYKNLNFNGHANAIHFRLTTTKCSYPLVCLLLCALSFSGNQQEFLSAPIHMHTGPLGGWQ